eukprot:Skav216583  [mRNA]  locus=scaffold3151:23511:25874:+ [translate_table: standard]
MASAAHEWHCKPWPTTTPWTSPRSYVAWEIDEDCVNLTNQRHQVHHRGNFLQDDLRDLQKFVQQQDPQAIGAIILTAGPPCPDYSRILGDNGRGRHGDEGIKFEQFCQWQKDLIPLMAPRKTVRLVENVVPHRRADVGYFEGKLNCKAIVWDAADFKRVSRPRVWWSDIDWNSPIIKQVLGSEPHWTKHFGTARLHCPQPISAVEIPDGWQSPECWHTGGVLHCLTTPAPTDEGRQAPRSCKGKLDSATYNRWSAAERQFAPWHYEDTVVMQSPTGELTTPPITTKETAHELPINYTANFPEKVRHRMLGNSWHVGMARLLLWILVLQIQQSTACATVPARVEPYPNLRHIKDLWFEEPLIPGPAPKQLSQSCLLEQCQDMWHHWALSKTLPNPNTELWIVEKGLQQVLHHQDECGSDLPNLRARVCEEVAELRAHLQHATSSWFASLPQHIQALYQTPESCIQLPLLHHLAELGQWQDPALLRELQAGFPLLGGLQLGLGWEQRTDNRNQHPLPMMDFMRHNEAYVRRKLNRHRVDPHWRTLAAEIAQEVELGRMEGPFSSPTSWPKKTVVLPLFKHTQTLLPGPQTHGATSVSFAIIQTGSDGKPKIRRGEDWRRAHHNQTVMVSDRPHNHRPPTFVALAAEFSQRNLNSTIWGSDRENAYRQLPVEEPCHTWTILFTEGGPTLWRHRALLFGATGSVWSYGRVGDFLCWLARTFLLTPAIHYVDDYAAVEAATLPILFRSKPQPVTSMWLSFQTQQDATSWTIPQDPRSDHVDHPILLHPGTRS